MSIRLSYLPCGQCGSQVPELDLQSAQALRCGLCRTVIKRQGKPEPLQAMCAFGMAGMLFLTLGNIYSIMNFSVAGNTQTNESVTGVGV